MAKTALKEKALVLRKKGVSIKEISSKLLVSSSTVSNWCRDITLSEAAIKRIADTGNKKAITALMRYSELKRKQRQKSEQDSQRIGAEKLSNLSQRDIYCIGLGLYWGEGYKRGNQEFGFTNSDPAMIQFYLKWLATVFCIEKENLILRISINELHKNRVKEVELYWSKLLSIPLSRFTKISLIKTKSRKVYANRATHMGTLRIKVRRGTNLRREVLGAIKSIY